MEQNITSPKFMRRTRNKRDTRNGWDSKCGTVESVLTHGYSGGNVDHGVVNGKMEVTTRKKRRSAPTQFLVESEEEEEEQEFVMYDPIQDTRKRKRTGDICQRKTKMVNARKSTVARSYSGSDQEESTSVKKSILQQRTRGGRWRRSNEKLVDECAAESQEDPIIETGIKPNIDCVIPRKTSVDVLTSSFQIPRKKRSQQRDGKSTMNEEVT